MSLNVKGTGHHMLATYVDDLEPKADVLNRLMDLIDRQAVAYGIYSRAIHEGANDAARDARRERWAERRDATEDALREALGIARAER